MALGSSRDTAETVEDLVTAALEKLSVIVAGEPTDSDDIDLGMRALRAMMRTWAALGVRLWLVDEETITLTENTASYTLDPRYLDVSDAWRRDGSGDDTPIRLYTREQYNSLPDKSAPGQPFVVFIDRQRTQTVAKVYPVPDATVEANGETVILAGKRQIIDPTASDQDVELPPEWSEAIIYNLAARLAPSFEVQPRADVVQMASLLYDQLEGQDRQGSIFMYPGRY